MNAYFQKSFGERFCGNHRARKETALSAKYRRPTTHTFREPAEEFIGQWSQDDPADEVRLPVRVWKTDYSTIMPEVKHTSPKAQKLSYDQLAGLVESLRQSNLYAASLLREYEGGAVGAATREVAALREQVKELQRAAKKHEQQTDHWRHRAEMLARQVEEQRQRCVELGAMNEELNKPRTLPILIKDFGAFISDATAPVLAARVVMEYLPEDVQREITQAYVRRFNNGER